jgi:hypothetical protein
MLQEFQKLFFVGFVGLKPTGWWAAIRWLKPTAMNNYELY